MELRVDSNHDMINLSELDLSKAKNVDISLGSTDLNIAIFSGSKKLQSTEMNDMFTKDKIDSDERVR